MKTNEELVYLIQKAHTKDEKNEYLDKLIKNNSGIVNKLVYHYSISERFNRIIGHISLDDLYQEGRIGLIVAAKRYDFKAPNVAKFITYAIHWINQRMYKCIYGTRKNHINEVSLDAPIYTSSDGEVLTLGETLEDPHDTIEEIEDKIYYAQLRAEIEEAMRGCLTLKQSEALKLYVGWYGAEPMTYEAIGELFGVKGKNIRGYIGSAKQKIRNTPWGRSKLIEIAKEEELRARNRKYDSYVGLEQYLMEYDDIKRWLDNLLRAE